MREDGSAPGSNRRFSLAWWTGGRGLGGLAQWPNPAITVWAVALILKWSIADGDSSERLFSGIAAGALVVWALDELLRGSSPVRRVMGAVVLLVQATLLIGRV